MPLAPLFQVRVGYEFLPWLMPFVESDVTFASTAYASRPPPPRAFWHYAAGAGLRLTFAISNTFGIMAQGSLGLALVSEQNVLSIYGYPNADEPNLYLGGELGFEWYPVNPHLALGVRGWPPHLRRGSRARNGRGRTARAARQRPDPVRVLNRTSRDLLRPKAPGFLKPSGGPVSQNEP